jgi:methyl-accepting chemotaxis protein
MMGRVVETMKGIDASSRQIADIIGVIDDIAFQTNLLALNAAVESARAGEQGRGFAVVANEVRQLAQRSAEAARQIKTLIADSVARVGRGCALVDEAGTTMTEIVGAIARVTTIVGEISSASAAQSTGVGQVGAAVGQMDQATQQNAALVEESAAAAESLKQQARRLVDSVAQFRL